MKSYGVTIQMTPLQQYFHAVILIFKYYELWISTIFSKRMKSGYKYDNITNLFIFNIISRLFFGNSAMLTNGESFMCF